jgi:hypothetical protein
MEMQIRIGNLLGNVVLILQKVMSGFRRITLNVLRKHAGLYMMSIGSK